MVSMADEFKIDWEKAIEDAAIEYADAYTEMQCDADNDHQREHREALKICARRSSAGLRSQQRHSPQRSQSASR